MMSHITTAECTTNVCLNNHLFLKLLFAFASGVIHIIRVIWSTHNKAIVHMLNSSFSDHIPRGISRTPVIACLFRAHLWLRPSHLAILAPWLRCAALT
jgi:hypothetical protein